ncbi:MAG: S-layer homology domain-containing protein [Lachnospirales bacterium]
MKKLITLALFMTLISTVNIYASNTKTNASKEVYITIESYDTTLSQGYAKGSTYAEVLENFAMQKDLEIVYSTENNINKIYSVNGIESKLFGPTDGWYSYIIRGDTILENTDILSTPIKDGDMLITYYGDFHDTRIIYDTITRANNKNISIYLVTPTEIDADLSNIKVHLYTPKNTQRIMKTNKEGVVTSKLKDLGYYTYYAEGYNYDSYPSIVRTVNEGFVLGPENKEKVTRGEFIDFLVNNFSIGKGKNGSKDFTDVSMSDFYSTEVSIACSQNIISGYDDKTFRGSEPITMLEYAAILARIDSNVVEVNTNINVPSWAMSSVSKAISKGYVSEDTDFTRNVTEEDLIKIAK